MISFYQRNNHNIFLGFTFSEGSVRPGMNPMEIAIIMKNFMNLLDYQKYYVQGGDWGGHIVQLLTALFPEKVIGLHSNFCFINTPLAHLKIFLGEFFPSLVIDDKVRDRVYPMMDKIRYIFKESGYMHIQATKPDTLGKRFFFHLISLKTLSLKYIFLKINKDT